MRSWLTMRSIAVRPEGALDDPRASRGQRLRAARALVARCESDRAAEALVRRLAPSMIARDEERARLILEAMKTAFGAALVPAGQVTIIRAIVPLLERESLRAHAAAVLVTMHDALVRAAAGTCSKRGAHDLR